MKNYEYIFWDFDGTLVDTRKGTRESAWYALKHFNKDIEKTDHLEDVFCGPPLKDSFKKFNLDEEEIEEAIKLYRKFQRENTIELSELFDGVKEMLEALNLQNKKLIIVTAKVEPTVIKILEYLEIYKYFDLVVGATEDSSRTKKDEMISHAMECLKDVDVSKSIMIGDRASDIKAGLKYRMDTMGVLYGMDSQAILQEAGATYIVGNTNQITDIIGIQSRDKNVDFAR